MKLPVERYLKLIKASKNVMRPFMFQNRVLIDYCQRLVTLYNTSTDEGLQIANHQSVSSALDEALKAIQAATDAHPNPSPKWSIEPSKEKEAKEALEKAMDSIHPTLEKFGAKDAKKTLEADMQKAATSDTDRFDKLKAWMDKIKPALPSKKEVSLTIKRGTQPDDTVKVLESTKVRELVWRQNQEDAAGEFTGASANGIAIELDKTIGELFKGGPGVLELTKSDSVP
ncbi:hypothetical protein CPB86DRAFT_306756 [Serendipita vermifera]|nr:hypothetical protein CPB86DRAFT_306756 [Serendipita vermifera]